MHTIDAHPPTVRPGPSAHPKLTRITTVAPPPLPGVTAVLGPRPDRFGVLPPTPVVDVVIPVHDEVAVVRTSVERLHAHLSDGFPFAWRITVVDNASTDGTWDRVVDAVAELDRVVGIRLDRKGRGLALRTAWTGSDAAVVAYMDVDLSTGLDALLPLVAPLVSGHSDLTVGSRLSPGSRVARGPRRELISRIYNRLLRTVFAAKVRDAQCGFKAVRTEVARRLLPEVADDGWFFDTELLLLADHNGLRIHEVPVDWVDDADSRVRIVPTVLGDLAGSARVAWAFATGRGRVDLGSVRRGELDDDLGRRMVTFTSIGAVSTAVSLIVFLLLRPGLGAVAANAVALAATFAANAWAHARFTLGRRRVRWGTAVTTFIVGLVASTFILVLTAALGVGGVAEALLLLATWLAVSIARLVLLQRAACPARTAGSEQS